MPVRIKIPIAITGLLALSVVTAWLQLGVYGGLISGVIYGTWAVDWVERKS